MLGTDKQNGLFVYNLDGEQVAYFDSGRLNNVDIRPFTLAGEQVKDIYGSAMIRDPKTGRVWALVNYKSGDIIQWEATDENGQIALTFARHLKVATQPEGMMVVMDDQNEMFTSNFKLVSWADVRVALGLR